MHVDKGDLKPWVPAFAGMTIVFVSGHVRTKRSTGTCRSREPPRQSRSPRTTFRGRNGPTPPRFTVRYRHLTRAVLGEHYNVGVVIEELGPGRQSAPAHYHLFEEEHLYILEGTATLRLGAGSHEMKAGDYVCLPAGQKAGHCLVNNSGAPCRYVGVGEHKPKDVAVYTDSNKVLLRGLGRVLDLGCHPRLLGRGGYGPSSARNRTTESG